MRTGLLRVRASAIARPGNFANLGRLCRYVAIGLAVVTGQAQASNAAEPATRLAQADPPPPVAKKAAGPSGSLLPGASSKDPISIEAGKLDYFDKEQKLVYTGQVVAKQGQSTLRASVLTILFSKSEKGEAASSTGDAKMTGSSVRHMEAAGPVTIVSKDQVGTGEKGAYDKDENKITLTGHVTLSQATNAIKGDKLVYDLTTGQAQVSSNSNTPVFSVFTPGASAPGEVANGKSAKNKPEKHPKTAPAPTAPK